MKFERDGRIAGKTRYFSFSRVLELSIISKTKKLEINFQFFGGKNLLLNLSQAAHEVKECGKYASAGADFQSTFNITLGVFMYRILFYSTESGIAPYFMSYR